MLKLKPFCTLRSLFNNLSYSTRIKRWKLSNSIDKHINNIDKYYLAKNIHLRKYQKNAVMYCLYIIDRICNGKPDANGYALTEETFKDRLLAFDMATGSGKTVIMATIMMYLYVYCNRSRFLYVINAKNIVNKTKENFWTNLYSSKNLFNVNNPKNIQIRNTSNLDDYKRNTTSDTTLDNLNTPNIIYICMSTSQKLNSNIRNNPSYPNKFKNIPLIIFADEAQHNNAYTKLKRTKQKQLSFLDKNSNITFEEVIDKVKASNLKTIELDFSGSLNELMNSNKNVEKKYKNKIIYYYPFKEFYNEKYSKNYVPFYSKPINVSDKQRYILSNIINSNYPEWYKKHLKNNPRKYDKYLNSIINNRDKMLSAIFLNTYRSLIINKIKGMSVFDPLILFKSNNIYFSYNSKLFFNYIIKELNPTNIKLYLKQWLLNNEAQIKVTSNINLTQKSNEIESLKVVYNFYDNYYFKNSMAYNLVDYIKKRYDRRNILDANTKGKRGVKGINRLNDLDEINAKFNKYNVIFAVNKLSEGWDVKSLFDIVRLQGSSSTASLNAEVQLMGRGSRYFPFHYSLRNNDIYKRCFDNKPINKKKDIDYRWLETLSYHTVAKDRDKFKNILINNDMIISRPSHATRKVKINKYLRDDSIGKKIFNKGVIYVNYSKDINKNLFNNIQSLKLNIPKKEIGNWTYNVINLSTKYININDFSIHQLKLDKDITYMSLNQIGKKYKSLLLDVLDNDNFFRFNRLSKYINIDSISDFINTWLGDINLFVICDSYYNLDLRKIISIHFKAISYLISCIKDTITHLENGSNNKVGTNKFYPIYLKNVIKTYHEDVDGVYNANDASIDMEKYGPYNCLSSSSSSMDSSRLQDITVHYLYGKNSDSDAKYYAYNESVCNKLEHECIGKVIHQIIPYIIKNKRNIKYALLVRTDQIPKKIQLHDFNTQNHNIQKYKPYQPDFALLLFNKKLDEKNVIQFYIEPKGEQLIKKDKWKEDLLQNIKPNNIKITSFKLIKNDNKKESSESKYINNSKIYGLTFYTDLTRNKPFEEMYKYLGLKNK